MMMERRTTLSVDIEVSDELCERARTRADELGCSVDEALHDLVQLDVTWTRPDD